ncbi:MAG: single-stranded DNA-binding protein [Burkholderiales bacterium]|nr:single-stranded DNA-binding protein [Burkholderiales bacterium]
MKRLTIIGNICADPVINSSEEGNQFATSSVTVDSGSKYNQKIEVMELIFNNKFVDFLNKYIVKGVEVFIGGVPSFSTYLSRTGEIVTSQWIYVDTIELLPTDVFNEDIIKCADEIECKDNNHAIFIDNKINIQNENHNFLD